MLVALATLVISWQTGPQASRFDFGERYQELDVAWTLCVDPERRLRAVPEIRRAMGYADTGKFAEGCQALDLSVAMLEGREIRPSDAVTVRFAPAWSSPGAKANLSAGWAYTPAQVQPVELRVANRRVSLVPGRSLNLLVDLQSTNPELKLHPESGYLLPVRLGESPESAYVSIVKRFKERVTALAKMKNPLSRALGRRMEQGMASAQREWTEPPYIDWLFTAERLEEGRARLSELEQIGFVDHMGCTFRVAFPKELVSRVQARQPARVVLAWAGKDGFEDRWFNAYGQGGIVKECLDRGWVFVAIRSGAKAFQAATDWLSKVRGLDLSEIYSIGHGAGAASALRSFVGDSQSSRRASGLALISPRLPRSVSIPSVPGIFVAVGMEDSGLDPTIRALKLGAGSSVRELPGCEGEMAVAEAGQAAIAFFASILT
ncbi:MAG: hypothetical protein HZC36_02245 [Armatimonadetes bacterium]|nr:hypothetical protein [Armatimonadota bacterium]